jgi:NADH-quinone oxidoreductase subunit M
MTHGVVSAGLFFCVGVLYDRYHTRSVKHYSGLAQVMPLFCAFLFLFTLGNLGFPGTGNFIGELLLVTGLWDRNSFVMVFTGIALVSSAIYSLWLFNRSAFGTLKIKIDNIKFYADINRREFGILLVLAIVMLALGIYSVGVTNLTLIAIKKILISIITKK